MESSDQYSFFKNWSRDQYKLWVTKTNKFSRRHSYIFPLNPVNHAMGMINDQGRFSLIKKWVGLVSSIDFMLGGVRIDMGYIITWYVQVPVILIIIQKLSQTWCHHISVPWLHHWGKWLSSRVCFFVCRLSLSMSSQEHWREYLWMLSTMKPSGVWPVSRVIQLSSVKINACWSAVESAKLLWHVWYVFAAKMQTSRPSLVLWPRWILLGLIAMRPMPSSSMSTMHWPSRWSLTTPATHQW